MERANGTFVLLKPTETVGFSSEYDEIWILYAPAHSNWFPFFSPEFRNRPSLVIGNFANGLYPRVYNRANRMKAFGSLCRVVTSRPPSSYLTEWHFSLLVSRPLRLITIYYARYRAESRATQPRNFARISVPDWVAKWRFRAPFYLRAFSR